MRIQCDACEKNLASVMCCADEAALCADCDTKIHAANKLANKHIRVPLLSAPQSPSCDICQERRAFVFCLEDRALLCRDCDFSIHKANSLSCNHLRFLITGTRVALDALKNEEPAENVTPEMQLPLPSSSSCANLKPGSIFRVPISTPSNHAYPSKNQGMTVPKLNQGPAAPKVLPMPSLGTGLQSSGLLRKSSFTDFLIDAIPGWRVDDLLNLPDLSEGYNVSDIASSKVDGMKLGDFDWTADLSMFEEKMFTDAFREVPQLPLPTPTVAAVARSIRSTGLSKGNYKQELVLPTHTGLGDAFVVPDLGLQSPSVSPPFSKRRRNFYEV